MEINMNSSSPLPLISAEQKALGIVELDYNLQTCYRLGENLRITIPNLDCGNLLPPLTCAQARCEYRPQHLKRPPEGEFMLLCYMLQTYDMVMSTWSRICMNIIGE
jgi:hypothetical protein